MREAVHKTTCGVDNHPGSTGALYGETWSCQLEREGGSLEISSSQKLYDMIRLTRADLIPSDCYSVIVKRRQCTEVFKQYLSLRLCAPNTSEFMSNIL